VTDDKETLSKPASAFIALGDGAYQASALTRGPWNPAHQHAGPPSALAAEIITRAAESHGFTHIARFTASLYRPIPIATIKFAVEIDYAGRNVGHLCAHLHAAGKEVARFTAVAQREMDIEVSEALVGPTRPPAPKSSDESQPIRFPSKDGSVGYADLMETRVADGDFFKGPCAVWFRLRHPLIAGRDPDAVARVAVAADSANGISGVLDFSRYMFLNNDLTINLIRKPKGEWICVDAQTKVGNTGCGLAEARLFDTAGLIGRSTQTLLIRERN
jgi:Thioesterase-like superfamily